MAGFSPCLTIESARVNLPSIAAWSCQQQQSWITRLSLALASSRTIDLEQVLWLTIYIYCICVPQQVEFPICLLAPFFQKPWTGVSDNGERIPSYIWFVCWVVRYNQRWLEFFFQEQPFLRHSLAYVCSSTYIQTSIKNLWKHHPCGGNPYICTNATDNKVHHFLKIKYK
jgi:hypothetical protein